MTNKKETYIKHASKTNYSKFIPIFLKPEWLDIVSEKWDVELYSNNETIIAALPFCVKGNILTKRIYIPDTNFYQSVIFFDNTLSIKEKNKIAIHLFEKTKIYRQAYFKFLPEYYNIDLSELKFTKKIYTTHIIKENYEIKNISKTHKRYIQKATQHNYTIKESINLKQSYNLILSTFEKQNIKAKIDYATFENLNTFGKTLDVLDTQENLLASIFYAEDDNEVYYLYSGFNTNYKNSGAIHFLLDYIIKYSINKNKTFNFCGSTKKSIANFFKAFGAEELSINIWERRFL